MQVTGRHIKPISHIILLCFVLFSFSPCSVKNVWIDSFSAGFIKLPAPSKTTLPVSSCSYAQTNHELTVAANKSNFHQQKEPAFFLQQINYIPLSVALSHHSKKFSGTAPPQYILYKRWKTGIA